MKAGIAWLAPILLVIGCAGSGEYGDRPGRDSDAATATSTSSAEETVALAAEIAKAIEADPDAAPRILERHGLTVERFEQMMYDISVDPVLSKKYEAARAE